MSVAVALRGTRRHGGQVGILAMNDQATNTERDVEDAYDTKPVFVSSEMFSAPVSKSNTCKRDAIIKRIVSLARYLPGQILSGVIREHQGTG